MWLQSGGCDGCSMALIGADVRDLFGTLADSGVRVLWHPALSEQTGNDALRILERCASGEERLDGERSGGLLGADFRAGTGMPVVNVAGCPANPGWILESLMENLGWKGTQAHGDCNTRPWYGNGSCVRGGFACISCTEPGFEEPGHPFHTTPKLAALAISRTVAGPFNRVEGDLEVTLDIAGGSTPPCTGASSISCRRWRWSPASGPTASRSSPAARNWTPGRRTAAPGHRTSGCSSRSPGTSGWRGWAGLTTASSATAPIPWRA